MHLVILRDYGSSCSFCIELVGAWKFLQYLQDIWNQMEEQENQTTLYLLNID